MLRNWRRLAMAVTATVIVACTGTNNTPTATPAPRTAGPATSTPVSQTARPTLEPTLGPTPTIAAPTPHGSASAGAPTPSASSATGSIAIGDSAAVDPISRAIAAGYQTANPGVSVTFSADETFAGFCAGQVGAYGSSRKILARTEAGVCATNKVDYVALPIALDAVAVVTSALNENLTCLGFPDIYALLGPESTGFTNWQDANALIAALGSGAEFADSQLIVAGPGASADASALLVSKVIAPIAAERQQSATLRTDYQVSDDAAALLGTLAGDSTAPATLGWLPFAQAASADQVKVLRLDGGDGCVNPEVEKILSGAYPLSRPLYLYVNLEMADANPALTAFVDVFMGPDALSTALETLPYVALPDDVLQESRFDWEGR